jgi:hypothetical protein
MGRHGDTGVSYELFTAGFWLRAITRTVRGGATAAIGAFGVGATDVASIPWFAALTAAGFGALMALLASLAEVQVADKARQVSYGLIGTQKRRRTLRFPHGIPRVSDPDR